MALINELLTNWKKTNFILTSSTFKKIQRSISKRLSFTMKKYFKPHLLFKNWNRLLENIFTYLEYLE